MTPDQKRDAAAVEYAVEFQERQPYHDMTVGYIVEKVFKAGYSQGQADLLEQMEAEAKSMGPHELRFVQRYRKEK